MNKFTSLIIFHILIHTCSNFYKIQKTFSIYKGYDHKSISGLPIQISTQKGKAPSWDGRLCILKKTQGNRMIKDFIEHLCSPLSSLFEIKVDHKKND